MLSLAACSRPASPVAGATVPATLKDYRILSSVTAVPAGVVSFHLHNRGPSTHQFGVFATDQPADGLPLGEDGLTIDWQSPLLRPVGGLAQIDIGQSETLVLRLPPGRYVLVCNMEGHYLGGMHLALVVH
jgi:uncharacterized cupredoxin-like copper-binding protein